MIELFHFLKSSPLHSKKRLDFEDFVKVAKLIKEKAHLETKGINEILEIKSRMNTRGNTYNSIMI